MDNKRPKRRKDKENPYTVLYRDGKAYIMFEDGQKIEQLVKVDDKLLQIIYVFLTIFLYLLKCPQSLIL